MPARRARPPPGLHAVAETSQLLTGGLIRVRLRYELSLVLSLPVRSFPVQSWLLGGHMSMRIQLWCPPGRRRWAWPSRQVATAAFASIALVLTALAAGVAATNASAASCGT